MSGLTNASGVELFDQTRFEQAVAASTGWNLPVKALPYWVRGSSHRTPYTAIFNLKTYRLLSRPRLRRPYAPTPARPTSYSFSRGNRP